MGGGASKDTARGHCPAVEQQAVEVGEGVWRNAKWQEEMLSVPNQLLDHLPLEVRTLYHVPRCGQIINPRGDCVGFRPGGKGPYRFLSYDQFMEQVQFFAAGLVKLGMAARDRVGFYAKNSVEWQIAEHGCYTQNMISVALYDTLGPDAVEYIVKHSETRLVVISQDCLPKLLSIADNCPSLEHIVVYGDELPEEAKSASIKAKLYTWVDVIAMGRENPVEDVPPNPEDTAIIMYTSGTTGIPKGVEITHGNMVADLGGIFTNIEAFGKTDRVLSFLPLAHIFERVAENAFFMTGGAIGYFSGDVRNLADDILALKPTLFIGVPRIYERLYEKIWSTVNANGGLKKKLFHNGFAKKLRGIREGFTTPFYDFFVFSKTKARLGGKVRAILSGGGPLRPEIQDFLRVVFCCPVVQGYGLTETCAGSSVQLLDDMSTGIIGTPTGCNEFKLFDATEFGHSSADVGELAIRGANVAKGYYKEPEKSAEVFLEDGWFKTGDIVKVHPNGSFQIIDRAKNIFKNALGEYIAPEKLEGAYASVPLVGQIFVYGDGQKSKLVAVVVPDEDNGREWASAHEPPVVKKEGQTIMEAIVEQAYDDYAKAVQEQLNEKAKEAKFLGFERVSGVILEGDPWTPENEMLTPTMKIKRPVLTRRYQERIGHLYETVEPDTLVAGAGSSSGAK